MKKSLNVYALSLLAGLGIQMSAMEIAIEKPALKSKNIVAGIPLAHFRGYEYLRRLRIHNPSVAKGMEQKKFKNHAQEIVEQKPLDPTDKYNHARDYEHIIKAFTEETAALLPDLKRPNAQNSGGWFSKKEELLAEPEIDKNGITIVELDKLTPAAQIAYRIKYDIVTSIAPDDLTSAGEPAKTKVLYDQDKFVGFITYIRDDLKNGHILFLYVDKSLRGKGYGKKLVAAAQKDLFNTGSFNRLWVPLDSANNAAINFYRKIGFLENNDPSIAKKGRVSFAIQKPIVSIP